MKKTFILRWNPEISSFTKDGFVAGYGFDFYDSTILTEDSFVSFRIVSSRGRKILVSAEKEIFVKYGAMPETRKFIRSLGFEKRDDIGMLEYLSPSYIERFSIFGKEFSDEVYYQIKADLKAEYLDSEDEDDLPF